MADTELNLIVLRSADLERAVRFYRVLGIQFTREQHGSGPEHFAGRVGRVVFEIYPQGKNCEDTTQTRIGFSVNSIADVLPDLELAGGKIIQNVRESEWGRRAVIADPDGHRVELVEASEIS
jgi:predicted enzyme related to lactoylglutathione lyase